MRSICLFVLLFTAAAHAQQGCENTAGTFKRTLASGHTVEAHAFTTAEGKRTCIGYISDANGEKIFEMAADLVVIEMGAFDHDLNADTKHDVVFRSLKGGKHVYSVVTPEATPALVREITTSVPLNFEDKDADGRPEIWARESVFLGIDGQPHENSPAPVIIFRMKGNLLMNVSPSFWPEYEREIQNLQTQYTKDDLWELNKPNSALRQEYDKKPSELARMNHVRGLLLQTVVDYLYAGKGQEGWKVIADYWLDRDKERVRQLILATRSRGLMSEVNKGVPAPSVKSGTQ